MKRSKNTAKHPTSCTTKTIFLSFLCLGFALFSFQASATKVGVIIGSVNSKTSPTNQEKYCILNSLSTSLKRHSEDLNFVFKPNFYSTKGTADATMQLINEQVDIVLLPLASRYAQVASSILTKFNIPFVTTASSNNVIKDRMLGLSTMNSSEEQAEAIANFFINNINKKRVHILSNKSDLYSSTISYEFEHSLFMKNPDIDVIKSGFSSNTLKAFIENLDDGAVVFAPLYNPNIAMLYMESVAADKRITILGTDSVGGRGEFYKIVRKFSDKVTLLFVKNWNEVIKGPNKSELLAYVKAYCSKEKSTFISTYTYDLVKLIANESDNLKEIDDSKNAIQVLRNSRYITAMDGVSLNVNSTGFNDRPFYLYKITPNGNRLIQRLNESYVRK